MIPKQFEEEKSYLEQPISPILTQSRTCGRSLTLKSTEKNCKTKENLFEAAKIGWEAIVLEIINNLITSMP